VVARAQNPLANADMGVGAADSDRFTAQLIRIARRLDRRGRAVDHEPLWCGLVCFVTTKHYILTTKCRRYGTLATERMVCRRVIIRPSPGLSHCPT
jgi:hypothetical protein